MVYLVLEMQILLCTLYLPNTLKPVMPVMTVVIKWHIKPLLAALVSVN